MTGRSVHKRSVMHLFEAFDAGHERLRAVECVNDKFKSGFDGYSLRAPGFGFASTRATRIRDTSLRRRVARRACMPRCAQ